MYHTPPLPSSCRHSIVPTPLDWPKAHSHPRIFSMLKYPPPPTPIAVSNCRRCPSPWRSGALFSTPSSVAQSWCWCRLLTTVEDDYRGVEVGVVIHAALLAVVVVPSHSNRPLSIPSAISVLRGSLTPLCRSMSRHRRLCLHRPKPVQERAEERRNKSGWRQRTPVKVIRRLSTSL